MGPVTRRRFLAKASAAAAAAAFPAIIPASARGADGAVPPSERIHLGFIGTGGQGIWRNLKMCLQEKDAKVVALCDVDRSRVNNALKTVREATGEECFITGDFREVLERDDVDAVVISTPDHWHDVMSIAAMRAGKDVCCEKPTLTIAGGRAVADCARAYGRVFQTATEDRSLHVYHRMAELVRNGRIGGLQTIRVGLPGSYDVEMGKRAKIQPVPEGFDYDMWLGPAPEAPYSPERCHYQFRWIRDYSGGQLSDWGAHLLDTAQWANDTEHSGPVEFEGVGEYPDEGIYDTATSFHIECKYADGVRMIIDSGQVSLRFEGTEGWIGNTGWIGRLEASDDAILRSVIGPGETHLFTCPAGEHRNFLDCVKTRREPYFPAEIGHRCATIAHIGNIAMELGTRLEWDPERECFVDNEEANRLRGRAMREPWTL